MERAREGTGTIRGGSNDGANGANWCYVTDVEHNENNLLQSDRSNNLPLYPCPKLYAYSWTCQIFAEVLTLILQNP